MGSSLIVSLLLGSSTVLSFRVFLLVTAGAAFRVAFALAAAVAILTSGSAVLVFAVAFERVTRFGGVTSSMVLNSIGSYKSCWRIT